MFCRNCGAEMADNARICMKCGVMAGDGDKFCSNCGAEPDPKAVICVKCGYELNHFHYRFKKGQNGQQYPLKVMILAVLFGLDLIIMQYFKADQPVQNFGTGLYLF